MRDFVAYIAARAASVLIRLGRRLSPDGLYRGLAANFKQGNQHGE